MFQRQNWIHWVMISILIISSLVSLNVALKRFFYEAQNQTVDLVLSHREVGHLANLGGVSQAELLGRLRKEVGITSIALEEETLQDFIDKGKVTLLPGSEIINMLRVGKVYRTIISHLTKRTRVDPNKIYLVADETVLYERIKNYLNVGLDPGSVRELGWNMFEVTANEEDLVKMGFGVSTKQATKLAGYGFRVVPRFRNNMRISTPLIKLKLKSMSDFEQGKTVVFEGPSVLGYPSKLRVMAEQLKENDFQIGIIEFRNQKGDRDIAKLLPLSVIRVHSVSDTVRRRMTQDQLITRYLRATKERGVRMLFLHADFGYIGETNIIQYNIDYFLRLKSQLNRFQFTIGPVIDSPGKRYIPATHLEIAMMSVGVFVWIGLFLGIFIKIRPLILAIGSLLLLMCYGTMFLTGMEEFWNRALAICVATVFPILALVINFPSQNMNRIHSTKTRYLDCGIYILKLLGISSIGALFVIGFLSDITYLLSVRQFFGVKISIIVPLVVIGLYYYLRPHRIHSFYYVMKRLFHAPITTGSLAATMLCCTLIVLYIMRSGNYVQIPMVEAWVRSTLESLFFVRPRTKEFLIGYPFLITAFLYVDSKISRDWLWFFNILGSIALLSFINSFCHLHTPIMISFYRSVLGVLLGILFAVLYTVIFR
ncbi:hypothetical protein HOH87_03425, partial [bacterium]|nr:hypothetical protein [bacterium]